MESFIIQKKSCSTIMFLIIGALLGVYLFSPSPGIVHRPNAEYDYIIVGSGTAGCVLAARLSANPQHSVLLVEAGHHFSWLSSVPLAAPLLQNSAQDWAYRTVPQQHSSQGLWHQISAWPRGRGLGGSGQINYMLHFSGNVDDFARWEELGAHGWGHSQIKYYMDRLLGTYSCSRTGQCPNDYKYMLLSAKRNYSHQEDIISCPSQHKDITVHVTQVDPAESVLAQAFLDAAVELKASGEHLQFSPAQSTIFQGQRWASMEAFLKPSLGRSNLHVLIDTLVTKVLVTKQKKAAGVEVLFSNGHKQILHAHREVILSAGAVNTPQILMLSGIGPYHHLKQLGIPVIKDVPVGHGLHDQLILPLYVSISAPVSMTLNKLQSVHQLWSYILQGQGYFSSSAIAGVGSASPNLGLVLFGMGSANEHLLHNLANFKPKTFRALFPFSSNSSQEGFVLLASCLQPHSRGTVTLHSTNPADAPVIDPQYLVHHHDVTCMAEAMRLAVRVAQTTAFQRLGAQLHLPLLDDCSHLTTDVLDDDYMECVIRTAAITAHHPGGTCRMGTPSDPATVIDPFLRVHGVTNLRVVDASIMPTPVSGHPNSIVMALADRAATLILQS